MKRLIEIWRLAREDSSLGELTYRMHGDYDRHHITHGWWVDPSTFAFGIGLDRDWHTAYDGRASLTIEVGPFCWALALCQPLRPTPKWSR